jgi:hypothetical protein
MKPLKNPTEGLNKIIITHIFILTKFHQKKNRNKKIGKNDFQGF